MHEHIGRTRIQLHNGTNYSVTATFADVSEGVADVEFATFLSVTGQAAFGAERLWLRVAEIASIQEISPESWIWQQRASELHYARMIEEMPASERYAQAAERMAAVLEGHDDVD
jgi:hypothetical protein